MNPVNSGYAVGIGGHIAFMPKCVPSPPFPHPARACIEPQRSSAGGFL